MIRILYILFFISFTSFGQIRSITQLETDFNTVYAEGGNDNRSGTLAYSLSAGENQEHYYMAWGLWGMIRAWQATGREDLYTDVRTVLSNHISTAQDTVINTRSYKHWRDDPEVPADARLWDLYVLKDITTFLRVVYQSRELYLTDKEFIDNSIAFYEKNIWERLEENFDSGRIGADGNLYGYDPYLSSLAAQSAMELYIITRKSKYKTYVDNINYIGCSFCSETQRNGANGSIRSQLRDTIIDTKTGFQISGNWEDATGADDQSNFFYLKPDMNHYSSTTNYIQLAYENNMYWTKSDVDKWIVTSNKNWSSNSPVIGWQFLDFTGDENMNHVAVGYQTSLGAHDAAFQARLNQYITPSFGFNRTHLQGQILYNQKIINDSRPIYPNYYPLDGGLTIEYRKKILKKKSI